VIVAHHGGELSPLLAVLVGAGTASSLLLLVRAQLAAARSWLVQRITGR
jgi:hypothetical protein